MLDKKVIPISKSTINLKCGDCIHFIRNAKFEKPCKELEVKAYADAPACYSPDVYQLATKNPEILYQIGLLMQSFSAKESRIFLALMKQATAFEKHYGLQFGQPVYFHVGHDYLSNYFRGFAIGVSIIGEAQVFVTSDLQKKQRSNPMIGSFYRDSVFTVTEFKKKKAMLQKNNRLVDPNPLFGKRVSKATVAKDDYVPPTMETAPKEWFDKTDRLNSKKKLKKSADGSLEFKVK